MIAVIFEVWLEPEHESNYLELAGALRRELEALPGFISIERFRSIVEEGKILSLSFFESEAAVQAWRNLPSHREAQALGRGQYFRNYRLRVATVGRDYGPQDREQAPEDSRAVHR